jgi:uncharacterized protein YbaP (TraB family)
MISGAWLGRLSVVLLLFLFPVSNALPVQEGAGYFDTGLLFKVDKEGGDPSFLFGTMHSEDPRVTRLPPAVRQAFDDAERFAMEVLMDEATLMESMAALRLTDGRDLEDIIGPSLYRQAMGAAGKLGYPVTVCRRFKPWALVTLLSIPAPSSGDYLDIVLYQQALEQGKQVIGLETVQEQLAPFDSLSDEEQTLLLQATLEGLDELPALYEELLSAYVRRDLAALVELNNTHLDASDSELGRRLNKGVIEDRNQRMAQRLLPVLKEGSAFVALGALHLPGKDGVLNLLQGQGYRIKRVY